LFLLVLALLRGNQEGWASTRILAELVGGGMLLAAFVLVERRAREPMLPLGLFRHRAFTGVQVAAFSISASFFALFLYTTLYLQEVLDLSPLDSGLVYLPGTILMFVVSGASAHLAKRTSPGALITSGLILVAAGLVLISLADVNSTSLALLPGLLVVCIGTGLVNPALADVALGSVETTQSGLAAGINDAFRQGGIAVGVAAFGALLPASAALGHGSPEDYVTGLHHALLIGAALAAAGGIATSRLIPTHSTASQTQPVVAADPVPS
jgi:predicted MFS family arabinose efflux permease